MQKDRQTDEITVDRSDPKQIELFDSRRTFAELQQAILECAQTPVSITLTQNMTSMISLRILQHSHALVRMHKDFLQAPDSIIAAIGNYIRTGRLEHWRKVAAFARNIHVTAPPARHKRLPVLSGFHDIDAIADQVNRTHFNGKIHCIVRWGRPTRRKNRPRSSISFGSWNERSKTITIHPSLDSADVPASFVTFIVFHEMLHATVPTERKNGKRIVHTACFRAIERRYPNQNEMRRLSGKILASLR